MAAVENMKESLLDKIFRLQTADEHEEVQGIMHKLERTYTPIQTIGFLNLGIAAEWRFLYSTATTRFEPRLRLGQIKQTISVDSQKPQQGNLTNTITWHLIEEGDCSGTFEINCQYMVDRKGDLQISQIENSIAPLKGWPANPTELVAMLQRMVPREIWEPDQTNQHVSFMDGDVRIMRVSGERGTISNVFSRLAPTPQ